MSYFRVKGCLLKQSNDWHNIPHAFGRNLLYAWR